MQTIQPPTSSRDTPDFGRIASFGALVSAARKASRGKRLSNDTARFLADIETAVLQLRDELLNRSYAPQAYRTFSIQDPKPRTISAAAFRDRVVHHALMTEIGPVLDRGASQSSYACRIGRGQQRAIARVQQLCRRFPYVLRIDIEHFFESLSHDVLLRLLSRRLYGAPDVFALARKFVVAGAPGSPAGKGVPIGNLTSQHFANFYLEPIDRHIEAGLRLPLVRYMDDFVIFGAKSGQLWDLYDSIETFAQNRLSLTLKARVTRVMPVSDGVPFLGGLVFPHLVRFDNARRRRYIRHHRRLALLDRIDNEAEVQQRGTSLVAWARHFSTLALRRSLVADEIST